VAAGVLGGLDADIATFFAAVEAVSTGDPAAGWVLMIAAETNSLATWMPAEARNRIFDSARPPICAGTLNPAAGVARRTGAGYLVTGRWPYASGIRHADWVISRCRLQSEDGSFVLDAGERPRTIVVATPASDVAILDTWHTSGLRGSGSEDYTLDGVLVEEPLAFDFGPPQFSGPRASLTLRLHFQIGHAAHALGTAAGALEAFRDLTSRPGWTERSPHELALAYRAAGEAEALTRSARAWMHELLGAIWARAAAQIEHPAETWPLLTMAVAHTVRTCVHAVDLLYEAAGAASLYREHRLEGFWRDMRAAGQHIHAKERHYADTGQALAESQSS
jgi:alkylation response protein AidB-like acyl-CoA dehydrogenase